MSGTIRILYGFFCEHCRLEANGQVTAIGLWGSECRFGAPAPVMMPALSFHAFLSNPNQTPISGSAKFSIPGVKEGPTIPIEIRPESGMSGHNINLSIGNVPITEAGMVKIRLIFNTEPRIDEEFNLNVKFSS